MIIIEPYLEKRPLKFLLMQALIVPIETEQSPTVAVLFVRSQVCLLYTSDAADE